MTTHHIGRIVVGCLTVGLVVALALVVGPLAGAQEHVITGTVLLAFGSSWALLAALSILWTKQPQRWAADARRLHGVGRRWSSRLRADRRGPRRAWVGLAAAPACASRWNGRSRPPGSAQPRAVVGRVPAVERIRAERSWRGLSNRPRVARPAYVCGARPAGRRRRTPASPELCRIRFSHRHPRIRPWRDCARIGDGSRPRSHATREYASTTARVEAGAIRRLPRRTASPWPQTSTSCSIARTFRVPLCSSAIRRARSTSGSSPAGIPNRSREWSCSTANRPKRSRAFQASQPSTVASAASLRCSRRWLDSAWDAWSSTPTSPVCLRKPATCSVSITRRLVCTAACATNSPSCRRRLRRPARFRALATDRWSS